MPKKAKELSALEINRLTAPGMVAVGGVSGLYMHLSLIHISREPGHG